MTEIVTGLRNQIQSDFDDSLTVTQSSGRFTIEDAQGRSLSVEQGAGTGYFLDRSQNSGAILTSANVQNNLSVAFDGDDLATITQQQVVLTLQTTLQQQQQPTLSSHQLEMQQVHLLSQLY